MTSLRVVLVTRQFWPLVGGAEVVLGNLAQQLQQRGAGVTVLTARWHRHWPDQLERQGVHVVRLNQPPARFWGTLSYMRALACWLRDHRGQFDLVYVSMLKHDAYAVLGAVGNQVPVVLRPEGTGATGDVQWQQQARFGRMIARRGRQAAALVAIAPRVREELIAASYPTERIHAIANGVPIPPPRDRPMKALARAELLQASPLLDVAPTAPLVVYVGRLHASKGLATLIAAWPQVAARWPAARLWLVGEGPARVELESQIESLGLRGQVVLAGCFDTVSDVYLAADAFVLPSHEELMSMALLEAMAAGLPIVASDIPGNRHLIAPGDQGLLVPVGDEAALGAAIIRLLGDRDAAACMGLAARRRAAENFSLARMTDAHLELFNRLIRR